ncbi:gamma-aminobutyric acid receptor subunit beta-like [Penaeus monodon]|uniref:gamma-aminobutyric acid receptor subunit beta-like n=1 Tax=Penaeus monodon TaxID=6687 RepID=UPI0018A6F786|nr:gamma-aminobutyric acid receptor subunit beta-like [Penaeus monodon]
MAVPTSEDEQQELYEMASTIAHICAPDGGAIMWLGISDAANEGVWQAMDTTNLTYENWGDNQPNGGVIENCAVMKGAVSRGEWADNSCRKSFKYCPVCRLVVPNYLRFRGICDSNLYDDRLILTGMKNNKPYFRGYYRSQVYYSSTGEWLLENILLPETFAVMEESGSIDFPIGRHMWVFSHGFCGKPPGTAISLALTQCESDEFTCNNGNCIPLGEVCDRRAQCTDKSDEFNCTLVLRPEGYQSSLPPEAPLSEGPLPVILNITIDSFREIDAINSRFIVELQIRMIWKDVRLQYLNLKSDRQLNLVLEKAANEMWVPAVDFLNAENNAKSLVDSNSKITIMRSGDKEPDNVEMSREAMIYRGRDSFIRTSRKYTATFACTFNFFYYPFNTDFCKMIFRVNRNNKPYVKLIRFGPGVTYDHKDKLNEFFIGRMRMVTYNSQEPYSGQQVIVEMKHLYGSQILTMFVPTTIISLIGYGTFFFKWYDFTNRIMVSLTVLLVLTQLFSQTSVMLPKTSYFKLIDIWFFGSITYTFVVIVVHTAVEYMHVYDHEIEDLHEKIQRAAAFYREITPQPTPGISDVVRDFSDSDEPQSVPETSIIARDDEGIEGTRRRRRRRRRRHRRHRRHGHKKRQKLSKSYLLPVIMKARMLWKAMQRPEAKGDRNPNFWPIVVDKLGNIVTTLVYILLNLVFWTVAFTQHVSEPLMDLDDPSYVESVENATSRVWPID